MSTAGNRKRYWNVSHLLYKGLVEPYVIETFSTFVFGWRKGLLNLTFLKRYFNVEYRQSLCCRMVWLNQTFEKRYSSWEGVLLQKWLVEPNVIGRLLKFPTKLVVRLIQLNLMQKRGLVDPNVLKTLFQSHSDYLWLQKGLVEPSVFKKLLKSNGLRFVWFNLGFNLTLCKRFGNLAILKCRSVVIKD